MKLILATLSFIVALTVTFASTLFAEEKKPLQKDQVSQVGEILPKTKSDIRQNKKPVSQKITYQEVDWADLVPKNWNPMKELEGIDFNNLMDGDPRAEAALVKLRAVWDSAPAEPSLEGKNIHISGFAVPLEGKGDDISEFLLVPYFGACIHTPPPPANQIIHVYASKTPKNFGMMYSYTVSGTLQIDQSPTEMGFSTYVMQADRIELYKE